MDPRASAPGWSSASHLAQPPPQYRAPRNVELGSPPRGSPPWAGGHDHPRLAPGELQREGARPSGAAAAPAHRGPNNECRCPGTRDDDFAHLDSRCTIGDHRPRESGAACAGTVDSETGGDNCAAAHGEPSAHRDAIEQHPAGRNPSNGDGRQRRGNRESHATHVCDGANDRPDLNPGASGHTYPTAATRRQGTTRYTDHGSNASGGAERPVDHAS